MDKREKYEPGSRFEGWMKRNMPTRESLAKHPLLRPFAHRFLTASLWRMNRRSVPRGVAIGLITGLVVLVPGFQIFCAVLLCPIFRANIPIAAIATFINTPVTTPPLIYLCYLLGQKLLNSASQVDENVGEALLDMSIAEWWQWFIYEAGPPMLLGLFVITVVTAAVGYLVSSWIWKRMILQKRKRRVKKAQRQ